MPASNTRAERSLPLSVNEPFLEAIVERIRDVVSRHSPESLDTVARTLFVAPTEFRALINDRGQLIDVLLLVDVVAAFVHQFAVDPEWLLAGHYNAATHREALMLVDDHTAASAHALRQFVRERYEKLRGTSMPAPPSLSRASK